MARLVIVLICGALVFVVVWQFAPHFIETYVRPANPEDAAAAADTPESKAEAAKKNPTATKARSGASRPSGKSASAVPTATTTTSDAFSPASPLVFPKVSSATAVSASGKPQARVTAENATIYLTNTSVGPVVGRLAKGAVVEPVFVVNSAGQNWTFVSASNEELAGFMRSDSLSRSKSAEPAAR
jgi:hypothetical protein